MRGACLRWRVPCERENVAKAPGVIVRSFTSRPCGGVHPSPVPGARSTSARRPSPPVLADRLRSIEEMRIRQPASKGSPNGSRIAFGHPESRENPVGVDHAARERSPPHECSARNGNSAKTPTPLSCITILRLQPQGHPTHRNVHPRPIRAARQKFPERRGCLSPSREHGRVYLHLDTIRLLTWMPGVPHADRMQRCLFPILSSVKNLSLSTLPRHAIQKEPRRILEPLAGGLRRLRARSCRLAAKNPARWALETDFSRSPTSPRTCPGVGELTGGSSRVGPPHPTGPPSSSSASTAAPGRGRRREGVRSRGVRSGP
jgi:hypothetical protein